jgi:uncharacterized membrane protein YccC
MKLPRVDFSWTEGAFAARLVIAAAASLFAGDLMTHGHGFSAVISALIVVRPYQQGALRAGLWRLAATLLGVGLAFVAVAARDAGLNDYVRLLIALVPLSLLVAYDSNYRGALIAAVLVIAAPGGHDAAGGGLDVTVRVALGRAEVVALGSVIGIAVSLLVLPQPHARVVARKAFRALDAMVGQLCAALTATEADSAAQEKVDAKLRRALFELGQMHRDNRRGHTDDDPSGRMIRLVRHAQAVSLLLRVHWRDNPGDLAAREAYCAALQALIPGPNGSVNGNGDRIATIWKSVPEDAKGVEAWLLKTLAGDVVRLNRLEPT